MESFRINSLIFLHPLLLSFSPFYEIFLISYNTLGQGLQTESFALIQLKQGFIYSDLDTWQLSKDCCTWVGVTCDESSGRIIGLDLSNRDINGVIAPSLFNLTSLRSLNFSYNYGISIPNYGWGRLANLSSLNLSSTKFTGKIPVDIFSLTKLTSLDLSYSYEEFGGLSLTSKPNFLRNMSSLMDLRIDGVDLSLYQNEWCDCLANFSLALEVLSMSNCFLSRSSFSSLSKLPYLYYLDISSNNLDLNILYSFANSTSLSSLIANNNQFNGIFPKQIFLLKKMQYLDISDNPMLSGSLPKFSADSKLVVLNLKDTNFFGNLPDTIGNLKFLKYLNIWNCHFSGRMPPSIGNLSQLEYLGLSNNSLQGHIPKSLFQISRLRKLLLGSNNFSGDLEFEFIKDMKNLVVLELSNNGLSLNSWDAYNGSFLSSFPKISNLIVASCNLTKIPQILNYPQKMFFLDLSNNRIHGEIPSWFWSINYLDLSCNMFTHIARPPLYNNDIAYIDLHSNMLEGPIPPFPLTTYWFIDFSNNHFTSIFSFNITSDKILLEYLFLANNSQIGEIPPFICSSTRLSILDLSNNRLSGSIPPCLFRNIYYLQVLHLNGNQLHGVIPDGINSKCNLIIINLRSNKLEEQLPKSLSNCQSLQVLDVGNNKLNDTFPHWLGNISSLKVLILRSNKFHGLIGPLDGNQERNYSFSMMHVLDISSNSFNGNLCSGFFSNFKSMMINRGDIEQTIIVGFPHHYYGLSILLIMEKGQLMDIKNFWMFVTSIDVSNNLFEGEIPITIGQLTSLQVLNMSHNCLTGKIIPQLGNLSQLESLDLSMNSLYGKIPQELASLYFLEYLNLSYNKLVGSIPVGGQFSTFPKTSFAGNEGLCLLPRNTSVPRVNNTTISSNLHNQDPMDRRYMIILGILFGVGFGGSMAVVLVLDVLCCDRSRRRRSMGHIDG